MSTVRTAVTNSGHAELNADVGFHKDDVLDYLSRHANIAQFVSFGSNLAQRHARIQGYDPDHHFPSLEQAVGALLDNSPDHKVNIRSFAPGDFKSREFIYGLEKGRDVAAHVRRLADDGLYTIINETIDVNDGGVSGVTIGKIIEFAPDDTPRCVEKPGTVSLPRDVGMRLLETVYNFRPSLNFESNMRVEWSLHPLRRGLRHEHTIIWELEDVGHVEVAADIRWPNIFSRKIGDKAFGLLVADALGLPVPLTTVLARALPPFTFGVPTSTGETWIRTCPVEQVPGRFTTQHGWRDPFKLLAEEDPEGDRIASVLAQNGVAAFYSGALVTSPHGSPIIEGVRGQGDEFMLGRVAPEQLPEEVLKAVTHLYEQAVRRLGAVRLEWVVDNQGAWVVQLHRGATSSDGRIIYPGQADVYHHFNVNDGIDALRKLIADVQGSSDGIVLVGNVGVTSHLGDLLRKARIPSKIETPESL